MSRMDSSIYHLPRAAPPSPISDLTRSGALLSDLAVNGRVAAATQNQALAALLFLYERVLGRSLAHIEGIAPARTSRRVPVVLSAREVRTILRNLRLSDGADCGVRASDAYGGGLRLMECVTLRVKDVDVDRRVITVRDGKGGKDRRTPLAEASAPEIGRWLKRSAPRYTSIHADDRLGIRVTGIGESCCSASIQTPTRNGPGDICFPQRGLFRDALPVCADGITFTRACSPGAVKTAVTKSGIAKRATCWHSFLPFVRDAPPGVRSGHSDRARSCVAGHTDVRTTMIYTHVTNLGGVGVRSPAKTDWASNVSRAVEPPFAAARGSEGPVSGAPGVERDSAQTCASARTLWRASHKYARAVTWVYEGPCGCRSYDAGNARSSCTSSRALHDKMT